MPPCQRLSNSALTQLERVHQDHTPRIPYSKRITASQNTSSHARHTIGPKDVAPRAKSCNRAYTRGPIAFCRVLIEMLVPRFAGRRLPLPFLSCRRFVRLAPGGPPQTCVWRNV